MLHQIPVSPSAGKVVSQYAKGMRAPVSKMPVNAGGTVRPVPLNAPAVTDSVTMNSIFAPVFMTFHKITDTHILATGGTLRGLFTPIPMGEIMQNLNWRVQWGFVFKKTIPFFWFPAHTITFLLPGEMRVLFAALLGVALGVILAVAARKK